MVIRKHPPARRRAMLLAEMVVAMAILTIAVLPVGFSLISDTKVFRATYQKAVAMEMVDGEMEILAAGAWRDLPEGSRPYTIHANALTNLPPGQFLLIRTGNHLRLEWTAAKHAGIGPIVREATVK
jgi:hypothetical protein